MKLHSKIGGGPRGLPLTFTAVLIAASTQPGILRAEEAAPPAAAPAESAETTARRDIWEYYVAGNSVLELAAIQDAVSPFLGPQRSVDDVDHARAALEAAYFERGYKTVAVTIPQQTVRNGVVRLDVAERRIGHLNVVGSRYHSIEQTKAEAPSLAEDRVPDFKAVEQDLVALNQQPDRRVTPALRAGSAPDTVDVDLAVDDDLPLHGSLELNNRKSQDTHELRVVGSLSYDNLWQRAHSLTLSAQLAPQDTDDAAVFFASYLARFGASPFSLLASYVKSDSNVATVGGTTVLGRGQTAGLRALWTLPGDARTYQSLSLGVDYKNYNNRTSLGGASFETPVRYYPFSIGYNASDRGEAALTQVGLSLNFANPKFGSTTNRLDDNRYNARGQQFYFRENLSYLRELPRGAQGLIRFTGQLTDQPLITSEEFSAGGVDSVRGYLESEALGDYGVTGTVELRSPKLPENWTPWGSRVLNELRVVGFVDAARLRLRSPLPEQQRTFDLSSVGAGFTFQILKKLDGGIDFAVPLQDGPNTEAGSPRLLFRVSDSF